MFVTYTELLWGQVHSQDDVYVDRSMDILVVTLKNMHVSGHSQVHG